jgi:hypothetical protein
VAGGGPYLASGVVMGQRQCGMGLQWWYLTVGRRPGTTGGDAVFLLASQPNP